MLDQNFWRKYFAAYDALNRAIPYQELLDDLLDALSPEEGDLVLDAGSGTGNLSILLKKKDGAQVISLDYSEEGLKIHKKKDPEAEIILGDLTKALPFSSEKFDKIVTNNVVYAIDPKKRKFLFKEFYRILKPEGVLVVSNPGPGFRPIKILGDHLKKSFKRFGLIKTLIELIKFSLALVKILYYNYLIKKENKSGRYGFMKKGEQIALLEESGFSVDSGLTKLSYSNQNFIDKGVKINQIANE